MPYAVPTAWSTLPVSFYLGNNTLPSSPSLNAVSSIKAYLAYSLICV